VVRGPDEVAGEEELRARVAEGEFTVRVTEA
jgi:exodeoxyribonuclease VII large subunit